MEMAKHKCSEDQRNVWAWGDHGGADGNVVLNHVTRPSLKFNWQSACIGICFLCEYTEHASGVGEAGTWKPEPPTWLHSPGSQWLRLLGGTCCLLSLTFSWSWFETLHVSWCHLGAERPCLRGHSFPPSVHYLACAAGLPPSPHSLLEHLGSALCPTVTIIGWDIPEVLTFGLNLGLPTTACSQSSYHEYTHNGTYLPLVLV